MHPQGDAAASHATPFRRHRPAKRPSRVPRAKLSIWALISEPFGRESRLPFVSAPSEEIADNIRVEALLTRSIAALAQLFQSVGAHRIKKAVDKSRRCLMSSKSAICARSRRFENIGRYCAVWWRLKPPPLWWKIALETGNRAGPEYLLGSGSS